jgi:hypothetical protein
MLKVQTKLRELTSGFYAYSPLFFASHSKFIFLPGFQYVAFAYLLNIITKLKAYYMLFSFAQISIVGFFLIILISVIVKKYIQQKKRNLLKFFMIKLLGKFVCENKNKDDQQLHFLFGGGMDTREP